MNFSEISEKIKNSCEFFKHKELFGDKSETLELQDEFNFDQLKIFFNQVDIYPHIIIFKDMVDVENIICLSEYFLWSEFDEYIKFLLKIADLCNYDKKILYKKIKFTLYEGLRISKTFYNDYGYPTYLDFGVDYRNKIFNNIENLTATKFNNYDSNIIFSGGLLIGIFENNICYDSDCDVWILNNSDIKINDILQPNSNFYSLSNYNILNIYMDNQETKIKKIQIIKTEYIDIYSVINSFDLDICCLGITNNSFIINANTYDMIISKKINCQDLLCTDKIIERLYKYKLRGFRLLNLPHSIEDNLKNYKHKTLDTFEKYRNNFIDKEWNYNSFQDFENVEIININKYDNVDYINNSFFPFSSYIFWKNLKAESAFTKIKNIKGNIVFYGCNHHCFCDDCSEYDYGNGKKILICCQFNFCDDIKNKLNINIDESFIQDNCIKTTFHFSYSLHFTINGVKKCTSQYSNNYEIKNANILLKYSVCKNRTFLKLLSLYINTDDYLYIKLI